MAVKSVAAAAAVHVGAVATAVSCLGVCRFDVHLHDRRAVKSIAAKAIFRVYLGPMFIYMTKTGGYVKKLGKIKHEFRWPISRDLDFTNPKLLFRPVEAHNL